MEGKIVGCGHSCAVIIRSHFVRSLNLKRGDRVVVSYDEEKGEMVISFPGARQLRLATPHL